MTCLPSHGKIACDRCHQAAEISFNQTATISTDGKWRITANPLSWGSREPVVAVLGFSKGSSAIAALSDPRKSVNDIPYATKRSGVASILHALRLLNAPDARLVERAIADENGNFHFGSLVRCSVEQRVDEKWIFTGNKMLEGFSGHEFGRQVLKNCIETHLGSLPASVKIVVAFGYGQNLGARHAGGRHRFSYVENVKSAMEAALNISFERLNPVVYYNDKIVVIHTEHFSEPANLAHWLDDRHQRSQLRRLSFEGVRFALARS